VRLKRLLIVLLVFTSVPVFAQEKKEKPKRGEKFYDFDNLLIDGELKAPNAFFSSARQRVKWGRLLRLRKSFVPDLMSTDKDPVLRK
jgi:hypothetical protein